MNCRKTEQDETWLDSFRKSRYLDGSTNGRGRRKLLKSEACQLESLILKSI
jgi:hypothetical protein